MSVSYPRGMSAPKMAPKSPSKPAGVAPSKKGIPAALTHHGHAGKALKAGDAKTAMHHIGHMMMALKPGGIGKTGAASPGVSPVAATGVGESMNEAEPIGMAVSSGMDEGETSPVLPPAKNAPSSKPNPSAMFAKMRGGK